jgi:DNA helicase-2/ATP-dependent DNA helicase PcrA
MDTYEKAYKTLNSKQREAVDTIDGPVMVIAGPGTGKTEVLALRIATILQKTDTPPESILSLTFTRSGVSAMRERLYRYIGESAYQVHIATFHSFATNIIEKYYALLGYTYMPQVLLDEEMIILCDEIFENIDWHYLNSRTDNTKYFHDLRALVTVLKREGVTPDAFQKDIDEDIENIKKDPNNISSRGKTKGELKKEAENKIERLLRTREAVLFYQEYEALKKERGVLDYDDLLTSLVYLVQNFEDVRNDLRENYLYVLVDEHQDSSGIQNSFLETVWKDVEKPNIFVVGDDRQLIYGFSGAKLDYFSSFKHMFGKAHLISLLDNYRSTKSILEVADKILKSTFAEGVLRSNKEGGSPVRKDVYAYTRDEVIGTALEIKKLIDAGASPDDFAVLVPKNSHIKEVVQVFSTFAIPTVAETKESLLASSETQALVRIMKIILDPYQSTLIAEALLDQTSGVPPLLAHTYLKDLKKKENFSVFDLHKAGGADSLFQSEHPIKKFGDMLLRFIDTLSHEPLTHIVSHIGNEFLIDTATDHQSLIKRIEIVRSMIHSATSFVARNEHAQLSDFIHYLHKMHTYGQSIHTALFGGEKGVHVMTLHKSKGLEYDHVYILHMNEEIVMSSKGRTFTLPEKFENVQDKKDSDTARRELYVALTRAKKYCTFSYACKTLDGRDLTPISIIRELPEDLLIMRGREETEKILLIEPKNYTKTQDALATTKTEIIPSIVSLVKNRFTETKISVSMLNNFFECPWMWYFRNFIKLPEVKTASLSFGTAVHSAIERLIDVQNTLSDDDIRGHLVYALKKEGVTDQKKLDTMKEEGLLAVKHYSVHYYESGALLREKEQDFPYVDKAFPELSFYGKVDLIEHFEDESIVVTDFKTGKSKTSTVIEKPTEEGRMSSLMRQLAMYSYLIYKKRGIEAQAFRLLFLEETPESKSSMYQNMIGQHYRDLLVQDIRDYRDLLASGEWIHRPCFNTGWGEKKTCEYCDRITTITK